MSKHLTPDEKLDLISLKDIDLYRKTENVNLDDNCLQDIKIKLIKEIAKEQNKPVTHILTDIKDINYRRLESIYKNYTSNKFKFNNDEDALKTLRIVTEVFIKAIKQDDIRLIQTVIGDLVNILFTNVDEDKLKSEFQSTNSNYLEKTNLNSMIEELKIYADEFSMVNDLNSIDYTELLNIISNLG